MTGSVTAGAKGICPTGWHIPTHDEITLLERTTCLSNGTAEATCNTNFPYDTTTLGERGTNEGTTLKNMSGLFRGVLNGLRRTDGSFVYFGADTYVWSSVQSGANALRRNLYSGRTGVDRGMADKASGFSVRCLKN